MAVEHLEHLDQPGRGQCGPSGAGGVLSAPGVDLCQPSITGLSGVKPSSTRKIVTPLAVGGAPWRMYLSAGPLVKSVAQRRGHVRELLDETHGDRDGPEPVVLLEADEGDKLL